MKLPNLFEKETQPQTYPAGSVVFRESEPGEIMYVVREGEVELRVGGRSVDRVLPDGFFGEMALVDEPRRSATAVALTDCTLVPISEAQFLFMVEETPFFALEILRVLSRRLRRQNAG